MDPVDAPADLLVAFGQAVRELRAERGLSQERLAEAVGLHRTYVGDIERGLRNLSLVNIVRIARGLAVEPAALVALMQEKLPRHPD